MALQSAKIEELFSNLKKKNADIYVKRAKLLRETVAKRTRLLSFNLSSMEFLIFSDRSMTGYNTGVDFIHVSLQSFLCYTDAQISLHTLLVKYYNDLLFRQSSERGRDDVT